MDVPRTSFLKSPLVCHFFQHAILELSFCAVGGGGVGGNGVGGSGSGEVVCKDGVGGSGNCREVRRDVGELVLGRLSDASIVWECEGIGSGVGPDEETMNCIGCMICQRYSPRIRTSKTSLRCCVETHNAFSR